MIRAIASAVAVLGLSSLAVAQDVPKAADLVGRWKLTKSSEEVPPGTVAHVVFAVDGKLTILMEKDGKPYTTNGTWKLAGKTLTVTVAIDNETKTETAEVVKLTAEDLHTKDQKGKVDEFKKATAKEKPKK